MCRIHCQRCQHRKHFFSKIALGPCRAFCVELFNRPHADAVFHQGGRQLVVPECVLGCYHFMCSPLDGIKDFGGAKAIWANVARLAFNLLFDSSDPNFEELVQIRTEDCQELDPFDQGLSWVLGFLQNTSVKFQPA